MIVTLGVMTDGVAPIVLVVRTRMTRMKEGVTTSANKTPSNSNTPTNNNLALVCCPLNLV